ncbi:translation initiation factor [Massilia sp. PWRC2]|uniref:translation initiation factor n=1 Tax=Massilia sp. PWRC2 TaxID=2804626 RepID=UPI003CEBA2FC
MSGAGSRLVYSTETGRLCAGCGAAIAACRCAHMDQQTVLGNGQVKVSRQTKGRGGKCVTVVTGVALAGDALTALGKQLRSRCGAGGTVKDGVIEIQGDHCDAVLQALLQAGHAAKRGGG